MQLCGSLSSLLRKRPQTKNPILQQRVRDTESQTMSSACRTHLPKKKTSPENASCKNGPLQGAMQGALPVGGAAFRDMLRKSRRFTGPEPRTERFWPFRHCPQWPPCRVCAAHLCGLGLCWTRGPTGSASMEGTPASNRRWSKDSLELENDRSWGPQSSGPECRVALLGVGVGVCRASFLMTFAMGGVPHSGPQQ